MTETRNNGDVWAEHGHPRVPCSPPEAVRGIISCLVTPSKDPALNEDERFAHGRRADSFPPEQIVYSLTDVEMILRRRAGVDDPLRQAVEALDSLVAAIYEVLADPDCEDRVRPGLILARLMADVRAAELRRVLDDNAPEAGDSNASS